MSRLAFRALACASARTAHGAASAALAVLGFVLLACGASTPSSSDGPVDAARETAAPDAPPRSDAATSDAAATDDGPYDSASDAPRSDACQVYYGAKARADALAAPCESFDARAPDAGGLQALCEEELEGNGCTPADRAIVAELAQGVKSCVDALGACTVQSEASWHAAEGACFHAFLDGDAGAAISSACTAALYVAGL